MQVKGLKLTVTKDQVHKVVFATSVVVAGFFGATSLATGWAADVHGKLEEQGLKKVESWELLCKDANPPCAKKTLIAIDKKRSEALMSGLLRDYEADWHEKSMLALAGALFTSLLTIRRGKAAFASKPQSWAR